MEMGTPGKFANAQTAVKSLFDDLETTNANFSNSTPIWVSLIPFGENVSIVERVPDTDTNTRNLNWFGPFEEHSPVEFLGDDQSLCAELRSDSNLRDDSPPSAGLFPVWYKKYMSDFGHHRPCHEHTMMPLTSDFSSLKSKIDSLTAIDQGTRIDIGILWAWRSLSPRWRGDWWTSDNSILPHNYNNDDVLKVIVVLTDGENFGSHNWVTDKTLISASELNDDTLDICEEIKFNGVEIFYIDYENPRGVTGELRQCASSSKHYFNAENASELRNAFKEISSLTSELALTK